MNEEARGKALVSFEEIIYSHAVGIDSDNCAIRQWSGLQEHRKRLADLRTTLRQEAARDIRISLRRDIRRELNAKLRMVKGEQLNRLLAGYFDRGKQTLEIQLPDGPSSDRHASLLVSLQSQFTQIPHWSDDRWKACLAAGGGAKRRFQYCINDSGIIVYFRALQGHSGSNLIDPSLQDNVVIQSGFIHYIYHIGCAFNLHSIINSGLVPGGQNSSKRQTVFFLPVDPRDNSHKDPEKIDLSVPRRAQYLHNAWKRHQDAVYWVDINLAIRKGLTFYQTRSNAIILQGILPAYCIPKVVRLKTGEVLYEKAYMSPRPPPRISLRHDWTVENGEVLLGSKDRQPEGKVVQQPEGEVARQAKFFQPTQLIPNPIRDRSGRPGITHDVISVQDERKTSRSQEISVNSFNEEPSSSDRTGRNSSTFI